MWDFQQY